MTRIKDTSKTAPKINHGDIARRLGASPIFYQYSLKGRETEEEIEYGYKGPGWYFYDENWLYQHGPYNTKKEAQEACKEYAKKV